MRPFGDHRDDGLVQVAMNFPVPNTKAAGEMVRAYVSRLGMKEPQIIHQQELDRDVTHFILYAVLKAEIDYGQFEDLTLDEDILDKAEIERRMGELGLDEIVVVGAATGTDTHSLGIDAILNMKGYNGEYGLERYKGFRVLNLGSQVSNEDLIAKAREVDADVILVSQTVTQQGLHKKNLGEFRVLLQDAKIGRDVITICGGPHLPADTALEFGFDKCFGKDCLPNHVASFILRELARRRLRTNA